MKPIIFVGGGLGSAACSAILAKNNFQTIILEKNEQIGGKASTYNKKGFEVEKGVHMFSRCGKGPHNQALKDLKAKKRLKWVINDPVADVKYMNETFEMPLLFTKPKNLKKFLNFLNLSSAEINTILEMFMTMLSISESEIIYYDGIDFKAWLSSFTTSPAIHDFLNCLSILFFALPYYRASAGEFIHCFKKMFLDPSFGYVKGGSGAISKAFIDLAAKYGTEVRKQAPVKRILVDNGQVSGVELENGELLESELVISNAGIRETVLKLVGEDHFSSDYIEYIKNLKDSLGYLVMKVALKEKITEKTCYIVMPENSESSFRKIDAGKPPNKMFLFVPITSNLDPKMAPNGMQLITIGTPCPSDPNINFQPWILQLKECVNEIFPSMFEKASWIEVTTPKDIVAWTGRFTGSAIGLAQSPEQAGENRPKAKSPIKGLYYVGADVEGRGIGTELAVDSALKLSSHLVRSLK